MNADIVDELEAEGSDLCRRAARHIRIKRTWVSLIEGMLRQSGSASEYTDEVGERLRADAVRKHLGLPPGPPRVTDMMRNFKVTCDDCGWRGHEDQVLQAPSPFQATDIVYGCPACLSVNSMAMACAHPECWEGVTCGSPLPDGGYTQTCGLHRPFK